MGTEDKTKEVDPERLDVSFGGGGSESLDADRDGKGKVKTTDDAGEGMDFEADGSVSRTGLDKSKPKEGTGGEDGDDAGDEGDATEETSEQPEDLGDWDPDNAETAEKFDARYFKSTDDGSSELNMDAFASEVAANAAKEEGTPVLNEATYGWLKDRMGVSKDYADSIIKGQIALRKQAEDDFYGRVGGKEVYDAKLAWAKDNYTADQKTRFNAAVQKGGAEAEEAIELLNTRWEKAGNKAPGAKRDAGRKGVPPRRAVSPGKTTTSAENPGGGGGLKPFADADEHRHAMAEAQRSGDKAKIALVRKRLAASTFWK